MQAFMAESKDTMKRLDRLDGAIVHMTDAIVLQGERLDGLQVEMRGMREAVKKNGWHSNKQQSKPRKR